MDSPDSTTPSSSTHTPGGQTKKPVNEGLKNALESHNNKEDPTSDRPSSPEPNCVICLERVQNKSFADACFHQFCYDCILEWSKVKAECPLCKQSFKSIIHSVVSMEDYQQYWVPPPPPSDLNDSPDDDFMRSLRLYDWGLVPSQDSDGSLPAATAFAQRLRAFRQRSFLTYHNYYQPGTTGSPSSRTITSDIWGSFDPFNFRRLTMDQSGRSTSNNRAYNSAMRRVFDPESNDAWHVCQRNCPVHGNTEEQRRITEDQGRSSQHYRRHREASNRDFRRSVYVRELRAKSPPPDARIRSTDPNFFSCNPACVHRLVPWLNRELGVLLHGREDEVSKVLKEILGLIKQVPLKSRDFYSAMRHHIFGRTEHFVHEFANFAASPHENLTQWDRLVQHERRRPRLEQRDCSDSGDQDDDGDEEDEEDEEEVDSSYRRRGWSPLSDHELERVARETRERGSRSGENDPRRRRKESRARPRLDPDGRGGSSSADRRRGKEEEERDEGEVVTPPRMTGRERTPGGDERREMNESAARNRHRQSSTCEEPTRRSFSTNTSPASPNERSPPISSFTRGGLYRTLFDRRTEGSASATSETGWETPPLQPSTTRFSPQWSDASPLTTEPKVTRSASPALSDVEVVGFVKAMADRTPIEVTLSSDEEAVSGNQDPDIILERRKKRQSKEVGGDEKNKKKRTNKENTKLRLRRKRLRDSQSSTSAARREHDTEGVVDVEMEEKRRSFSRWSSTASTASSSSSSTSSSSLKFSQSRWEHNSLSTADVAASALTPARSSSGDSNILETLRLTGTFQNTEVIISDSDRDDDDDDVIFEAKKHCSILLTDSPPRHRRLARLATNEEEENSRSSSSSTQASSAPVSTAALEAKVWDFIESSRRQRELADRAREGRKESWIAEEEEEEESSTGRKRRRSSSRDGDNRSKSPGKKKCSSSKGKGKGKGKSSSRKTEDSPVVDGGGGSGGVDSSSGVSSGSSGISSGSDSGVVCSGVSGGVDQAVAVGGDGESNGALMSGGRGLAAGDLVISVGDATTDGTGVAEQIIIAGSNSKCGEVSTNEANANANLAHGDGKDAKDVKSNCLTTTMTTSPRSLVKLKSVVAVSRLSNGKKHKRKKEEKTNGGKGKRGKKDDDEAHNKRREDWRGK